MTDSTTSAGGSAPSGAGVPNDFFRASGPTIPNRFAAIADDRRPERKARSDRAHQTTGNHVRRTSPRAERRNTGLRKLCVWGLIRSF